MCGCGETYPIGLVARGPLSYLLTSAHCTFARCTCTKCWAAPRRATNLIKLAIATSHSSTNHCHTCRVVQVGPEPPPMWTTIFRQAHTTEVVRESEGDTCPAVLHSSVDLSTSIMVCPMVKSIRVGRGSAAPCRTRRHTHRWRIQCTPDAREVYPSCSLAPRYTPSQYGPMT